MKRLLRHPLVQKHGVQGMRFIVTGALGAMIELSSLTIFVSLLRMSEYFAFLLSTLLAVTFVFFASKHFTFRNHEKEYSRQAIKFAIVYGSAIFFNVTLSSFFLWFGLHYLLCKVLAIGIVMFWNYALSHGFVFRTTIST